MEKRAFRLGLGILFLLAVVCLVKAVGLIESNQWEANLTGVRFSAVAFGDVDNDNRSDLVVTGCLNDGGQDCENGVISKIYTNNGTALIENRTWQQNLTGIARGGVAWGDINNDGRLDLLISGCDSSTSLCNGNVFTKVYTNNGTSLIENNSWGSDLNGTWGGNLAFADVNNDGRLDLVLVGYNEMSTSYTAQVYINNGSCLVENTNWQSNLMGLFYSSLSFADVNNDGWIDLGMTGRNADSLKKTLIYINNGSSFVENSTWEQNLRASDESAMIFGDINNDGRLDMILMGCCDYLFVYKNNGTSFVESQKDSTEGGDLIGIFSGSLAFGDCYNNGTLDFAVIGRESGRSRIYQNNGTGYFFEDGLIGETIQTDDFITGAIAWNDIDIDNDLDLIVSGYSYGASGIATKIYVSNSSLYKTNSLPYTPTLFQNYSLTNGNVFLGWNNGSDNETISTGLYYNLRVGTTSGGNNILSGVFGGSSGGEWRGGGPASGYFGNMMQRRNISLSGSRFQVGTTYYWSVQTIDTGLAKSAWSAEQTFILTSDFTPPVITANAPSDGLITNQTRIVFNATVYDDYILVNVSLYGNWSGGWHNNETNASGINSTDYIFIKNLTEGNWLWGIRACDNLTNCRSSANYTIRIDTIPPSTFLMSPANSTTQTSSTTVTFSYNVSDVAINNCSLLLNDAVQRTNTSITVNASQTFTETLSNGNYNWSVRCTDAANNINSSVTYKLTVSYTTPEAPASSSGSGGGGGGAAAPTNKVSKIIQSISAGNNLVEFTEKETAMMGVEEILIDSASAARYVKVSVEKLNAKPTDIESAPTENVYTYLQIEKTILNDTDIKEAKIKFIVNKTWLQENNYDSEKVLLNRFTTKWEQLQTKLLSGGSQFYYYEATSLGFSLFAITAEKKIVEQEEVSLTENVTEKTNLSEEKENVPQQEKIEKGKEMWYLALAAAIVMLATILLIKLKKRKREKR